MASAPVSTNFPEGYGDLVLESSDGAICYFPGPILAHMSPVFQDMLTLGGDVEKAGGLPIKITEPLQTLELFLIHLDPKSKKPPIDKDTIADLLEMAEKYQVDAIAHWFDEEAINQRKRKDGAITKEFAVVYPFIAFPLAARYNLAETARLSLRELCSRDSRELLEEAHHIGLTAYINVCRARDVRIKRYEAWLDLMTQPRPHLEMDPNEFEINNSFLQACTSCTAKRSEWLIGIMKAIQTQPSWESFNMSFESDSECCFAWSDFWRDCMPEWEEEALREESKLPEWPISGS